MMNYIQRQQEYLVWGRGSCRMDFTSISSFTTKISRRETSGDTSTHISRFSFRWRLLEADELQGLLATPCGIYYVHHDVLPSQ